MKQNPVVFSGKLSFLNNPNIDKYLHILLLYFIIQQFISVFIILAAVIFFPEQCNNVTCGYLITGIVILTWILNAIVICRWRFKIIDLWNRIKDHTQLVAISGELVLISAIAYFGIISPIPPQFTQFLGVGIILVSVTGLYLVMIWILQFGDYIKEKRK